MALFSKKTEKKEGASEDTHADVLNTQSSRAVLLKPHVTEKAALLSDAKVYTFVVSPETSKNEVMKAVKEAYGVEPVKVRMVSIRDRVRVRRGQESRISDGKKAYVYLDKKDSIELF